MLEWQRPDYLNRIDESIRDAFIRVIADPSPEDRLLIVDIDESSLSAIGPWPWPRSQVANLVDILLGPYEAKLVGLDIVFPAAGDIEGDTRLAVLAENAPLVLAQIFDYTPRIPPLKLGLPLRGMPANSSAAIVAHGFISNHVGFERARCVGNIGYLPDSDGVLRHLPTITLYQNRYYGNFTYSLLECGRGGVSLQSTTPTSQARWQRVSFSRALSAYTIVPAQEILSERFPKHLLQGRYVLVGSSSLSLGDRVSIPLAPLTPGFMVHAENLSGLLDQAEGIGHSPWSGTPEFVAWLLASMALVLICVPRLSAWENLLILLGITGGWLTLALWGANIGAEWSITAPLWAYLFLLLTTVPHEWWQMQRKAKRLINTFSHYVAQPVLNEILRRDISYSLTPTLLEVTVLIADMEGYTRITSSLSLEDAANLTKDFLNCLTRPVLARGGTLDKYSGDGLVSFWGAPLACPEQADQAVSAGLDILSEISIFNHQRETQGLLPVRVRIGIESGMALVGDLGTSFRSTYTAVGDCINFASRLESAARNLPTSLVIGEVANSKLRQHRTCSLGSIDLRGTKTTINIFTVDQAN